MKPLLSELASDLQARRRERQLVWLGALALLLICLMSFFPAVRGVYIWDDEEWLLQNPLVHRLDGLRDIWLHPTRNPHYYPMVFTTFWLEFRAWGLWGPGYHIVNIWIHGLAAIGLFLLLRRLSLRSAWVAAAIWALHPIQVESVAWVTERKNVLAALFFFLALRVYLAFDTPEGARRWRWYPLALVLLALALFSKTITCIFPFTALLLLYWKRPRLTWREVYPLLPMLVMSLLLGWMTTQVEHTQVGTHGPLWHFTLTEKVLIAGRGFWFYLHQLLWPYPLLEIYPRWDIHPQAWWLGIFPLSILALLWVCYRRRHLWGRGPLTALLYFIVALGPSSGFISFYTMLYTFVADHYQYLAGIGPIVALSEWAWRKAPPIPLEKLALSRWTLGTLGLLVVLGTLTWNQAMLYRSDLELWTDTLRHNPDCFPALNNRGVSLVRRQKYDLATACFRHSIDIFPDDPRARYSLALSLITLGQDEQGRHEMDLAMRLNPTLPNRLKAYQKGAGESHPAELLRQAKIREAAQRWQEALGFYQAILDNPSQDEPMHRESILYNQANCHFQLQHMDEAIKLYRQVLEIDARKAEAWFNLGTALEAKGQKDEARRCLDQARLINPQLHPQMESNLPASAVILDHQHAKTVEDHQQGGAFMADDPHRQTHPAK